MPEPLSHLKASFMRSAFMERPAVRPSEDLRLMALTYGVLYLLGAAIALGSLALPADPDRIIAGALAVIGSAAALGLVQLLLPGRLPRWLLALNPAISGLLVAALIYYTSAPTYVLFMFWVVATASYFFSFPVALGSVLIACGGYGIAIYAGDASLPVLRIYLAITTLTVAAATLSIMRHRLDSLIIHLHDLSRTDALTGLANRRDFDERLGAELERAMRAGGRPIGMVILDLDNFKRINDRHGHQVGDACLVRFAGVLSRTSRNSDLAARLGGEEFAILVPEIERREEVLILAGRILDRVRAEFSPDGFVLTVSAGVAMFPEDATSGERLIGSADAALYEAKRQGRDRFVSYADIAGETSPVPGASSQGL